MDDPNITMKEYIRIEEEKAQRRGLVFDWQTAKLEYDDDGEDFETEFPAIVFNATPPCEPTVSPPNDSELDFRISCDESDDEDYTVIFDENLFSYKIVYVNDLKTVSENDGNNVALSPNPTIDHDYFNDFENEFPAIVYNNGLTSKSDLRVKTLVSTDKTDEFNPIDETSLSEYDEEIISCFNDLFNNIHSTDSKSEIDNDDNNISTVQPTEGNEFALRDDGISETCHNEIIKTFKKGIFVTNLNIIIYYCVIGVLFFLIMNLYVSFGIPFDPKWYYKDGPYTKLQRPRQSPIRCIKSGYKNPARYVGSFHAYTFTPP
ncbi:hypothetical protein Tco_0030022 [Tanacetum coccineum]